MSAVPLHKKRSRQDVTNESQVQAKRPRKTTRLELLQDNVKEISQKLNFYLTKAETYIPTNASTLRAKEFLDNARFFFTLASEGVALRRMVTFLESDSHTVFSGVTPQVEPGE